MGSAQPEGSPKEILSGNPLGELSEEILWVNLGESHGWNGLKEFLRNSRGNPWRCPLG